MKNQSTTISRWQQFCLGFLCLLSPIIRLLPGQTALLSGSFGWLSTILSAVPLLLLFLLIRRFLKNALPNEGFAELFIRALGKWPGKIIIMLFTFWLIFYTAFSLRSGADRYISSAYQNSPPAFFVIILLLLALLAVMGSFRAFSRTAEVFFPLLVVVIVLVVFLAYQDIDFACLHPFLLSQTPQVLKGIPPIASVMGVAAYFGFLEGRAREKDKRTKTMFLFMIIMLLVIIALCVTTVGTLGAETAAKYHFPFFGMVRNISFFNLLDRLDALIIALWVITDFALISTLLFIIVNNLRVCFGYLPDSAEKAKIYDLKNGRWLIWAVGLIIGVLALIFVPNSFDLINLSKNLVPIVNLFFSFGLLPLTIIICLLLRRV